MPNSNLVSRTNRFPDDLWEDAKTKAASDERDAVHLSSILKAALIAYVNDDIELEVKYGEVRIKSCSEKTD